jgi:hypothetical protein
VENGPDETRKRLEVFPKQSRGDDLDSHRHALCRVFMAGAFPVVPLPQSAPLSYRSLVCGFVGEP